MKAQRDEPAARISNRNNLSFRIQTPQVIRIACDDGVSPLPGKEHHRSVDNIRRIDSAAEFSTRTSKVLIKRNNLHFHAPQETR